MSVYDVIRGGVWIRQIVASNQREADSWVRAFMGDCVARFAYRLQ